MYQIDCPKLRELRQQRHLTMAAVARSIGYESKNGYWRIENGISRVPMDKLFALAKLFAVPVESLVRKGGDKPQ